MPPWKEGVPLNVDVYAAEAGPGPASTGAAEPEELQKTPVQWVEGLVQQMSAARNLQDARVRAAQELRAFEQAVIQSANKVSSPCNGNSEWQQQIV